MILMLFCVAEQRASRMVLEKTIDYPVQVPKGERRMETSAAAIGPLRKPYRLVLAAAVVGLCVRANRYELSAHPRIFVTRHGAQILDARAAGPLRSTYEEIKVAANRAVAEGIQKPRASDTPLELLSLGICYM